MKPRRGVAVTILHICFFLNIPLAIGCAYLVVSRSDTASDPHLGVLWFVGILCTAFCVGQEITAWGLKRHKFWAWVSRVCLSALIVPTTFLPLGVLGLWGFLAAGSRRESGMRPSPAMIGLAIAILTQLPGVIVSAKTVSIPETGITFDAPEEFSPLTREELLENFPGDLAPAYAIGNIERTCVIAYDLTSTKLPPEKLSEAKSYLESILPKQLPGLVWIRNELITIQSQQWIYLEGTQSGDDGAVHNILLFTSFRGRMLRVSFNSNKEDFPKVERAYRESIKTISLRPK